MLIEAYIFVKQRENIGSEVLMAVNVKNTSLLECDAM
jgi:hypothetical protein